MDPPTGPAKFDPAAVDDDEPRVSFEFPRGLLIFVGVMLVPAVAALAIYIGAALVVGDVRAADAQPPYSVAAGSTAAATVEGVYTTVPPRKDVAGWKRALVYVCQFH